MYAIFGHFLPPPLPQYAIWSHCYYKLAFTVYAFCKHPLPPACVRTKWKPPKVTANRKGECQQEQWDCVHRLLHWGGRVWDCNVHMVYNGMTSPMIEHLTSGNSYFKLWVANVVPYLNLGNSIVPQVPKYIGTYSTNSPLHCDLFHSFNNWLWPILLLR